MQSIESECLAAKTKDRENRFILSEKHLYSLREMIAVACAALGGLMLLGLRRAVSVPKDTELKDLLLEVAFRPKG